MISLRCALLLAFLCNAGAKDDGFDYAEEVPGARGEKVCVSVCENGAHDGGTEVCLERQNRNEAELAQLLAAGAPAIAPSLQSPTPIQGVPSVDDVDVGLMVFDANGERILLSKAQLEDVGVAAKLSGVDVRFAKH